MKVLMEKIQQNSEPKRIQKSPSAKPLPCDMLTGSKKMYDVFKEQNPKIQIDFRTYKNIIEEINIYYLNHILETGNMVFLPNGLGKMVIQKNKRYFKLTKDKKSKYLKAPVNWAESQKQNKIIYYLNENTDGYTYRFSWLKRASYINPCSIWSLVMTKFAKNLLKERIESSEKDYRTLYKELLPARANMALAKLKKK